VAHGIEAKLRRRPARRNWQMSCSLGVMFPIPSGAGWGRWKGAKRVEQSDRQAPQKTATVPEVHLVVGVGEPLDAALWALSKPMSRSLTINCAFL